MSRMNRGKRPWKQREKRRFRKSRPALSEHHLVPRSQGGEGGPTILVRDDKHRAWHLLVRNNLSKEAAVILSEWLPEEDRFFSFSKKHRFPTLLTRSMNGKKIPVKGTAYRCQKLFDSIPISSDKTKPSNSPSWFYLTPNYIDLPPVSGSMRWQEVYFCMFFLIDIH